MQSLSQKKVLNSHYNIETSHAAKLFSQCIVHEEGREGFASFFEKENHLGIKRIENEV